MIIQPQTANSVITQFASQTPTQANMPAAKPQEEPVPNTIPMLPEGLLVPQTDAPYIVAAIPTSREAGEIAKSGIGNIFSAPWQHALQDAMIRNGGLGNAEEGYLAWSEIGFVRLKNTALTPEQNQRLAEISLEMGIGVEKLPSRTTESGPTIDQWVNEFIAEHDAKLQAFVADPSQGMTIKDGRRRYVMEFNQQAGGVVSYYYKKHGGLRGWIEKNFKWISPIADIVSLIPGVGPIGMMIAQGVKALATTIVTGGKLGLQAIGGFVSSLFPGAAPYVGAAAVGVHALEDGKLDPLEIANIAGIIEGLIDGPTAAIPQPDTFVWT